MYEVPDIIDYPELYKVKDNLNIFNNVYCYFIKPYILKGISIYIGLRNDKLIIRSADFKSNITDPRELTKINYINLPSIIEIIKTAKIFDACFYFSNDILVDVMVSINKFMGPGMIRDIFGNIVKTQDIIEINTINDSTIKKYSGMYVKPSRFRHNIENNMVKPLYGII